MGYTIQSLLTYGSVNSVTFITEQLQVGLVMVINSGVFQTHHLQARTKSVHQWTQFNWSAFLDSALSVSGFELEVGMVYAIINFL